MVCHHQWNKDTANQGGRGVLQTNTVGGKLAGSLTAGETSHAENRENNSLQTSIDSIVHFLKQYSPVKLTVNTERNVKWRGFTRRSLDLLCDTFTAGLLTVYTEGKQLGIRVRVLSEQMFN